MTQRILDERLQILGEDVVATADERERARRLDEADRPARARTEGDVVLQVVPRSAGRRGEIDRIADERRIHVDAEYRSLEGLQVLERQSLAHLRRGDELP